MMPLVDGLTGDTEQVGDLSLGGVPTDLQQGRGAHPTVVEFFRGTRILEPHAA